MSHPQPAAAAPRPAVVVLTTTFPARPGDGTPEFVLTLARSIPDHDVTVIAPRMPGAARDERVGGVRVRRVAYFPRRWEGLAADAIMPTLRARPWRVVEVPFLVGALLLATWREVRRHESVVVNPHWILPAGLVALVVRALTGTPYVVTVHGADAYMLRGALGRRLKRPVLRHASAVLPVSDDIGRTLGLRDAPVLRMGVDTREIRAAVGERAPEPGQLVCIGRLADKKGVDVLVDAVGRLDGVRLDVGRRRPRPGGARAAGRPPGRRRPGAVPRQAAQGRGAGRAAPGLGGGHPVTGRRRRRHGGHPGRARRGDGGGGAGGGFRPGRAGGVRRRGVDGLLVPPDDVDALATALTKVADGSIDTAELGRAATAKAERTLDIGAVGTAYAGVLDEAAGRRRR